jgi:cell wall assembly regulator SMI1
VALTNNKQQQVIRLMPQWLKQQFAINPEQLAQLAPSLNRSYQQLIAKSYQRQHDQKQQIDDNCNELLSCCLALKSNSQADISHARTLYPDSLKQ